MTIKAQIDPVNITFKIHKDRSWRNTRITTPDAWNREKPEPGELLEREIERREEGQDS